MRRVASASVAVPGSSERQMVLTVEDEPVQQSLGLYPGATVTVFEGGTVDLADIFADSAEPPTPKANPFTASADGSWFFYAADELYDIRISGAGLPAPFTIGGVGIGFSTVPSSTFANLPGNASLGQLMRVTDELAGLWLMGSAGWAPVNNQTFANSRWLQWENAAGNTPVDVIRLNASDQIQLAALPLAGPTSVQTGRILLDNGSAALPAIAFTLPPNVGLYRAGGTLILTSDTTDTRFHIRSGSSNALIRMISNHPNFTSIDAMSSDETLARNLQFNPNGGQVLFPNGVQGAPSLSFINEPTTGFYRFATGAIAFASGGGPAHYWDGFQYWIGSNSGSIGIGASNDTKLVRDAANTLAMRNGANPQMLRIYSSFTDAANYQRLDIGWQSGIAYIAARQLGGVVQNDLAIGTEVGSIYFHTASATRWGMHATSGALFPYANSSYDIGFSTLRVRTGYFVTVDGTIGNFTTGVGAGPAPATTGDLRISNNTNGLMARNAANTGNLLVLFVGGDDNIYLAPSPAAGLFISGKVHISGMPTSAAGLSSGALWNNGGIVNIVP